MRRPGATVAEKLACGSNPSGHVAADNQCACSRCVSKLCLKAGSLRRKAGTDTMPIYDICGWVQEPHAIRNCGIASVCM